MIEQFLVGRLVALQLVILPFQRFRPRLRPFRYVDAVGTVEKTDFAFGTLGGTLGSVTQRLDGWYGTCEFVHL